MKAPTNHIERIFEDYKILRLCCHVIQTKTKNVSLLSHIHSFPFTIKAQCTMHTVYKLPEGTQSQSEDFTATKQNWGFDI